jgi:transmembrane sensor
MASNKLTTGPADPALGRAAQDAIDWEIMLRDDGVTAADREAFETWRQADEAHDEAWTRLQERLGRFAALEGTSSKAVRRALDEPSRARRRSLKAGVSIASAVLAAAGTREMVRALSLDADFRNGQPLPRRISLSDETPLTAGARARLYTADQGRGHVYLAAGQLATDQARAHVQPLVVTTRDGSVSTDGARVSVDVLRLHTVVAVQGGNALLTAHTGERVRMPDGTAWSVASGKIARMPETSVDIFSWTRGALVVLDRPFSDVVETLQRYYAGYIRFPSSAYTRRVSGVFTLADIQAALSQLAESLGFSLRCYGTVMAVATEV